MSEGDRTYLTISGRVPEDDWMNLPEVREIVMAALLRHIDRQELAARQNTEPCYFQERDGGLDLFLGDGSSRTFCGHFRPGALPPRPEQAKLN